eukprot:gnl/Dysnectes_brevis/1869_a2147_1168.p1 GENE.gnl/Dysnectes_brevis/1869_a2147_1168~~gnl/Dysnectes_brevis/1869_a2147_1168.p1  ORF type:complete len:385 (+),score=81.52 gnl/Dysnectes_brevis/1869_a2147_1168:1186-2340(+)
MSEQEYLKSIILLSGEAKKLGGPFSSSPDSSLPAMGIGIRWDTRVFTLSLFDLSWSESKDTTKLNSIPLSAITRVRDEIPGIMNENMILQLKTTVKRGKTYHFAFSSTQELEKWRGHIITVKDSLATLKRCPYPPNLPSWSYVQYAALAGHLDMAKKSRIVLNPDIFRTVRTPDDRLSLLHIAVKYGVPRTVQYLRNRLDVDMKPYLLDAEGMPPLLHAAHGPHCLEAVRELVSWAPNCSWTDSEGRDLVQLVEDTGDQEYISSIREIVAEGARAERLRVEEEEYQRECGGDFVFTVAPTETRQVGKICRACNTTSLEMRCLVCRGDVDPTFNEPAYLCDACARTCGDTCVFCERSPASQVGTVKPAKRCTDCSSNCFKCGASQ